MKHFTVEEAVSALKEVRPLAERMTSCARELGGVREALGRHERAISGNGGLDPVGHQAVHGQADDLAGELARILERLEALGVQVKDLESGLVDFPAVHPGTGETVLLCWRVGEEELRFWHGRDEGFAGRKPLPF
ncbi:MAG: DUF2203 domain-containing protein [Gaiellales bacterium]